MSSRQERRATPVRTGGRNGSGGRRPAALCLAPCGLLFCSWASGAALRTSAEPGGVWGLGAWKGGGFGLCVLYRQGCILSEREDWGRIELARGGCYGIRVIGCGQQRRREDVQNMNPGGGAWYVS